MVAMTKRLFDIDDDLLERARLALGTESMTETVREALRRVTESDPGEAVCGGHGHSGQDGSD